MMQPLMPLATAVWLVENTTLTFKQIADFCNMHEMEIQGVDDGEIGVNIEGQKPILTGQLSRDNVKACEADENKNLEWIEVNIPKTSKKAKNVKYIPIAKRRDKPDGTC